MTSFQTNLAELPPFQTWVFSWMAILRFSMSHQTFFWVSGFGHRVQCPQFVVSSPLYHKIHSLYLSTNTQDMQVHCKFNSSIRIMVRWVKLYKQATFTQHDERLYSLCSRKKYLKVWWWQAFWVVSRFYLVGAPCQKTVTCVYLLPVSNQTPWKQTFQPLDVEILFMQRCE